MEGKRRGYSLSHADDPVVDLRDHLDAGADLFNDRCTDEHGLDVLPDPFTDNEVSKDAS